MSVIPGNIETDQAPPMTIPLQHFVVGFAFLLLGAGFGVLRALGFVAGIGRLAHVHLLLVGWVVVTIMGAMTQFVPVWSAVAIHSRRLATLELQLVGTGLLAFVVASLLGWTQWLWVGGTLMLVGLWVFVYNIARTLAALDEFDVTERHFAVALGFFLLVSTYGFLLALDFPYRVLPAISLTHTATLSAHATLAVLGAVMTTVVGALYQLSTMFTQTKLHGVDHHLRRVEEASYPLGVLLLAHGRLFGSRPVAWAGGALVLVGLVAVSVVLGRRLVETQVEWTPMLSRYAVVTAALPLWAVVTAPAWARNPLSWSSVFGPTGGLHLLLIGVVGFVVLGTLYHVVPFIVWVHRYSDRLGLEKVPMIDDLYRTRLAMVDFWLVAGGSALFVAGTLLSGTAVTALRVGGGALATVGFAVFAANMLLVVREHSPYSLGDLLAGVLPGGTARGPGPRPTNSPGDPPNTFVVTPMPCREHPRTA
ncbi:hypothetical protein ACFQH6_10555 [Halobacteriaceae archaeon GCM10025711]